LYLKTDVLLLADVFENFRETCLHHYKLDPCHYMSSPGLSWDAMLKVNKINLDLISDIDMQLFLENRMRGGISYIAHRHAKANNTYMQNHNPGEESSYLMYLDTNNLYGRAMSQPLPYRDFKWIDPEKIILEVDLEYHEELHDLHNDYPLAPEKIVVTDDVLSDYCRNIKTLHGNSSGTVSKLIPTLNRKTKYVLHYQNLKQYLSLGLRLTKIHRAVQFTQRKLLKSYIDFNTKMRKDAKTDFEKDFFKLMNNSVYGKTMENLKKICNVQLVTDEKKLNKLTSNQPTLVIKYLMKTW